MVALNETGSQILGVVNEFYGTWKHSVIIAPVGAIAGALFLPRRHVTIAL
jgi:hypothetical protein